MGGGFFTDPPPITVFSSRDVEGWAGEGSSPRNPLPARKAGSYPDRVDGFAAVDFGFAREVLQRGSAALFLVAFASTLNQFRPLLGERGLLPAPMLLDWIGE